MSKLDMNNKAEMFDNMCKQIKLVLGGGQGTSQAANDAFKVEPSREEVRDMCVKTSIGVVAVGEEDGEIEAEVMVTEKSHTPGLTLWRIGKMTMER